MLELLLPLPLGPPIPTKLPASRRMDPRRDMVPVLFPDPDAALALVLSNVKGTPASPSPILSSRGVSGGVRKDGSVGDGVESRDGATGADIEVLVVLFGMGAVECIGPDASGDYAVEMI